MIHFVRLIGTNIKHNLHEYFVKLVLDLMSVIPKNRPTCLEILTNSKLWKTHLNDIPENYIIKLLPQTIDIKENFIGTFLKIKNQFNSSKKSSVTLVKLILF
jgi:serine/threonine protein kinase